MDIRFRPARPGDAEPSVALLLDQQPFTEGIKQKLPELLAEFIADEAVQSMVFEDWTSAQPTLGGFAATGFVEPRWLDLELAQPKPGLVERLYRTEADGQPLLLRPKQIAIRGADSGLDLVFLHFATVHSSSGDNSVARTIHGLNAQSFMLAVSGFFCRRLVHETWEPTSVPALTALGFHPPDPRIDIAASPILVLDTSSVSTTPFHPFAFLFSRQPRRFGFSPSQQNQLRLALWHLSDEAIAAEAGISVNTVRKRWDEIFRRAEATDPELFGRQGPKTDRTRGPDRRRSLMAYLATHMEELRPVANADDH